MQISKHVLSLKDRPAAFESPAGSITRLGPDQLPILKGLSIRRLVLTAHAIREPHWHANANELGYCVRGQALVTVVGNHGSRDVFLIGIGEMFFVPSGTVHAIENTGETEAEFILAFSNEDPDDFSLSGAFDVMSDAVLLSIFEWQPQKPPSFGRLNANTEIFDLQAQPAVEKQALHPNRLKFRVEESAPHVSSPHGLCKDRAGSGLVCSRWSFDVFCPHQRDWPARTALAPRDRRNGLCARRDRSDDSP